MHKARACFLVCAGLVCMVVASRVSAECRTGLRPIAVANVSVPFQYVEGREYALLHGFAPGNYQCIDFAQMNPPLASPCTAGPCAGLPSGGAALLRCMIQQGFGCCVDEAALIRVQTGVSSGTVGQGIDALFDDYGDIRTQYSASQTYAYQLYLAAGGNDSRVLPVPLVEFVLPDSSGSWWGRVNGFARFFLKRRFSTGTQGLYGEFVPELPTVASAPTWGRIKLLYR